MSSRDIIEALHQSRIDEGYKTIAGVHAEVDKDGKVLDEKAKKKIEGRTGKKLNEDEWKTMKGSHILVDNDGDIIAGGPEKLRKKASKKEVAATKKNADAKSKKESEKGSVKKSKAEKSKPIKHDMKKIGYALSVRVEDALADYDSKIDLHKSPDNTKLSDDDRDGFSDGILQTIGRELDPDVSGTDVVYKGKKIKKSTYVRKGGVYQEVPDPEADKLYDEAQKAIKNAKTLGDIREFLKDLKID